MDGRNRIKKAVSIILMLCLCIGVIVTNADIAKGAQSDTVLNTGIRSVNAYNPEYHTFRLNGETKINIMVVVPAKMEAEIMVFKGTGRNIVANPLLDLPMTPSKWLYEEGVYYCSATGTLNGGDYTLGVIFAQDTEYIVQITAESSSPSDPVTPIDPGVTDSVGADGDMLLATDAESVSANEAVSHEFTVGKRSELQFAVFVPYSDVSVDIYVYDSDGNTVVDQMIRKSDWEYIGTDDVYGYVVTQTLSMGDYTLELIFSGDTRYIAAVCYGSGSGSSAVETASLDKTSATITVGFKTTLKVKNTSGKVTWVSSNSKVASVNSNGVVTGNKAGSTVITAKTADGQKLTCKVTVKANEYKEKRIDISDATDGCTVQVYKASYNKNGDLVLKCRVANNTSSRIQTLKNFKVVFKSASGKTVGTYSVGKKKLSVPSGSVKNFTVVIKKSALKDKNADLRECDYTVSGTFE